MNCGTPKKRNNRDMDYVYEKLYNMGYKLTSGARQQLEYAVTGGWQARLVKDVFGGKTRKNVGIIAVRKWISV